MEGGAFAHHKPRDNRGQTEIVFEPVKFQMPTGQTHEKVSGLVCVVLCSGEKGG